MAFVSVEKEWKGEPGDKRNTKYALSAWGAGPIGISAYSSYRNSEKSKMARAASIEAKRAKRRKKKAKEKASVTKMIANGEHTYLTSRVSKRLPVADSDVTKAVSVPAGASRAVRMLADRANNIDDMVRSADPATAARGRRLRRRMTDGMTRAADVRMGLVEPRVKRRSK